jgi:lysophospholipase L1-like esterase
MIKNKIMIKNIKWLLIASLSIVACNKDEDPVVVIEPEVPVTAGSANFAKYVALGNSLSAGFSDSALFKEGQKGSYTKLMSDQFALAGGGAFNIPYMNDNRGGFLIGGAPNPNFLPRLTSLGVVNNSPNISIASPYGSSTTEAGLNIFNPAARFNNMGVPGAKSFHLVFPGYGAFNPYFGRMASTPTASIFGDALAQVPTFFSLWIGNNDVLGNALAGGVPTSIDPAGGDITPAAGGVGTGFDATYTYLVNTLTSAPFNAKGVLSNIPYVTSIPQFTTVPYNPLTNTALGAGVPANGIANIRNLNTNLYGPLNAALSIAGEPNRIKKLSETVANPLLIFDRSLAPKATEITTNLITLGFPAAQAGAYGAIYSQVRQATKEDLVLLATQRVIGTVNPSAPIAALNRFGISSPLRDKDVLTNTEKVALNTAVDGYNVVIKNLATLKGLAFVDSNQILQNVARGITFGNGYQISASYVVGGAFSYDGVHPSPRGYALLANEFLKSINATYGSTFRSYDLSKFPIQIPTVLAN